MEYVINPAISPEQDASKIVKRSQQMAKLCRKLKWLVFFLGHSVVNGSLFRIFSVKSLCKM